MAHHGTRSIYDRLTDRLNRLPQGAPPSESLFRILKILFSEREAELVSALPDQALHRRQGRGHLEGRARRRPRKTLEALASRALLVDWEGPSGAPSTSCRRPWPASSSSR